MFYKLSTCLQTVVSLIKEYIKHTLSRMFSSQHFYLGYFTIVIIVQSKSVISEFTQPPVISILSPKGPHHLLHFTIPSQ